jgi:hypothetical protein
MLGLGHKGEYMNRLVWTAVILAAVASGTVMLGRAASTQAKNTLDGEVVRVARRDVGSVVKATGIIKPRVGAEVRVGSGVSGVGKRLYVQIGDTVRKGQLLAKLDEHLPPCRGAEQALDGLEALLQVPYQLSPEWLRIDPNFAPLRGHPRFERLLLTRPLARSQPSRDARDSWPN